MQIRGFVFLLSFCFFYNTQLVGFLTLALPTSQSLQNIPFLFVFYYLFHTDSKTDTTDSTRFSLSYSLSALSSLTGYRIPIYSFF